MNAITGPTMVKRNERADDGDVDCTTADGPALAVGESDPRLPALLFEELAQVEPSVALDPVVHLRSGTVLRYVTPARWSTPAPADAGPTSLDEVTELTGVLHPLGDHVLGAALDVVAAERMLPRWQTARISVDLSPSQLLHPRLVENVVAGLALRDVGAEVLHIELTGSFRREDAAAAAARLTRLRSLGVRIGLGGVGTLSNLADLRDLPIDSITIDRRFVDSMDATSEDASIVRSIVALAHELAVDVVAEGVERPAQHFALLRAGCTAAQGSLYGAPRVSDESTTTVAFPERALDGVRGPVPPNEEGRLNSLADARILDTPPERTYDELVAAAARLCGTPTALISLVDADRQWFKATYGLDISETPRDVAFCAHTICGEELLEVSDASVDPRFAQNPFVEGDGGVRFYAGVPLTTSDGHNLGSLCVIDTVPRLLTADERLGLISLAEHASALIDRRLSANVARRAEHELDRLRVDRDVLALGVRATARTDPLTGLANRAALREVLHDALDGLDEGPLAVVICGIDDFSLVSDGLGQDAGNRLLVEVAGRLRTAVAPVDTVARLDNDEFAIVVRGAAPDVVEALAHRIVGDMSEHFLVAGREVSASVSVGIAEAGPDAGPDDLLHDADTALSRARALGGSRFTRFESSMRIDAAARLSITSDLRAALSCEELFCLFQPEVDAATGRPVVFETLVRWRHPLRGVLPPCEFLPYLSRRSDHDVLFARVLACALEAQASWFDNVGILVPVAVNVASVQLEDDRIVDTISNLLERHGAAADALWIEVVETNLAAPVAVETLTKIHRLGTHLALDDFGVGYSSLERLLLLPWDMLKIDRTIVERIDTSEHAMHVIKAVIAMAHALDMRVVGEGVETVLQHDRLREWGCDIVQGFGISVPIDMHGSQLFLQRTDQR